jgi:hypothetical protein
MHGDLLADKVQTGAYPDALRATITPDSAVLDIGTGPASWQCLLASLARERSMPWNALT